MKASIHLLLFAFVCVFPLPHLQIDSNSALLHFYSIQNLEKIPHDTGAHTHTLKGKANYSRVKHLKGE